MYTSPSSGVSKPAIILSTVVFPHPVGPIIAKNSASLTVKLTLSTAITFPNLFETFKSFTYSNYLELFNDKLCSSFYLKDFIYLYKLND
jgi:hypothetical protein